MYRFYSASVEEYSLSSSSFAAIDMGLFPSVAVLHYKMITLPLSQYFVHGTVERLLSGQGSGRWDLGQRCLNLVLLPIYIG